jgi:hypothetical protein
MDFQTEKEEYILLMDAIFKDGFTWVKQLARIIYSFILMDHFIEVLSKIRKNKVSEDFFIIMDSNLQVHGNKVNPTAQIVSKSIPMEVFIRGTF